MFFSVLLLWSVVVVVLIYFFFSLYHHIAIVRCIRKLPGPPSKNFFLGNIEPLHGTEENLFTTARKWGLEYYPIYQVHAMHAAAVNILNPYDLETILSSIKHIEKSVIYKIIEDWLGTGLLTSGGAKWHDRRKILTPSFHFNILQDFIEIFNEETERLVAVLKNCDDVIDVTDYVSGFTLNTIGETAMGMNFNDESLNGRAYKEEIQNIGIIYNYRLLRPWLLNKFTYFFDANSSKESRIIKILHKFTRSVIAKREEQFKPVNIEEHSHSKKKRLAMLDLLLTAKKVEGVIDDEGIREEVDTFMFEGHDTTAAAICFALMLIANHPEVQERIVEEIRQVVGDCKKPTYAILQELKYMDRCIKEVLRLYPSVPFIARVLGEDMVTHNGYLLKAGSMVHIHIYDLHHNPNIYPDPEKFDPDRFLLENCRTRHNFAYIPFSAGPRNCIGQKFATLEIKSILCGILSEFVLEPVDTPSSLVLLSQLVVRTKNGIRVKFVPRSREL